MLIILIIIADFGMTALVVFNVLLTDIFIAALINWWGLELNPLVMVNVIVAIGTSVDFSAHIAYAYLVEEVPDKYLGNKDKIRTYKAG